MRKIHDAIVGTDHKWLRLACAAGPRAPRLFCVCLYLGYKYLCPTPAFLCVPGYCSTCAWCRCVLLLRFCVCLVSSRSTPAFLRVPGYCSTCAWCRCVLLLRFCVCLVSSRSTPAFLRVPGYCSTCAWCRCVLLLRFCVCLV